MIYKGKASGEPRPLRQTHNQPACLVGALAPYNHSVPLAGVLGYRLSGTGQKLFG
jgi:hypothetical protein